MSGKSVTDLAERQWGVVTRAQLFALGLSRGAIDNLVRRGRLRRIHAGVYAPAGVPLRDEGVWLAAVLACGPGAVLSHQAAGRLWGMWVPWQDRSVHVTVTAGRAAPPGITVHRTRHLTRADVTVERGIQVTTRPRTVVDCADTLSYEELRALADHGVRMDVAALERARARAPGRRGSPNLARLIASDPRTRSKLERAFRKICRQLGVDQPLINEKVLGIERDFVWRAQRLVVETDGGTFHLPKLARERDYDDDARLVAAGWRVVRFSHDQILHESEAVAARLASLLTA